MEFPSLISGALVQIISAIQLDASTYNCTVLYTFTIVHYKMWSPLNHFRQAGVPVAKLVCAPSRGLVGIFPLKLTFGASPQLCTKVIILTEWATNHVKTRAMVGERDFTLKVFSLI